MAIEARNITKRFGDYVALDDVTVHVPDGCLTALLGPSGSGKSTLLRVIAGLEAPDAGTVLIEGRDVTTQPARKREVGFVFQHYAAFKHMTVADNVAFGMTVRKRPKDQTRARVAELLELVGLSHLGKRYPSQLSGGQRQRMALARALAVEPRVLLLDEPFGALDARVREELRAWLRRLHDEVHVTTIFVTHDQEEAMEIAEQIVVVNEGRIEQSASPAQIYDEPVNRFVMSVLGPVSQVGEQLVRPHDIAIAAEPGDGARPASVARVVHLSQVGHRLPSQLSGGQRQRMALARALAVEPRVLLLDEPFGALDAKVRKELREWLRRLHDEVHVTTVFVTHDQEEALEVADQIVVINDGRIEQIGAPDELYDKPANNFVMSFLGPVTTLGGHLVRPHDIDLSDDDRIAGSVPGVITRMQRIGFEVRLHVRTDQDPDVLVTMTRTHARGLEKGAKVWLVPTKGASTVAMLAPVAAPREAPERAS